MEMKLRHNKIVIKKSGGFYGRIIKSLPNDKFLWLCCGLHFHISAKDELDLTDYKGYYIGKRFVPMTSLRNLKRLAKRYHHDYAFNTPLDYEYIKR